MCVALQLTLLPDEVQSAKVSLLYATYGIGIDILTKIVLYLERQVYTHDGLFISPHQRKTLEASRLRRIESSVSVNSAPVAADTCQHATEKRPLSLGCSTEEDMDLSSDDEDDANRVTPSLSVVTDLAISTREPTPALIMDHSDSESVGGESDVADWLHEEYNGYRSTSVESTSQVIIVSNGKLTLPESEHIHGRTPLFIPSPYPSPRSRPHVTKYSDAADPIPFRIDYTSGLFSQPGSPVASQQPVCPVRAFLDGLRRPLGHHYSVFHEIGVRTQEDIHALSYMSGDWEVVHSELAKRGVTLMEWLYIKAGLDSTRQAVRC
jgi:hypothetical protein